MLKKELAKTWGDAGDGRLGKYGDFEDRHDGGKFSIYLVIFVTP